MKRRAPREVTHGAEAPGVYEGAWAILARWLLVPRDPPAVPPGRISWAESFRPALAHYNYLRFQFWIVAASLSLGLLVASGVLLAAAGWWGVALGFLLALLVVGGLLAGYLLLRLRFDTTWYVMTDRALRVRRGILTIREATVTYENVQNVRVTRDFIQRWLGIGDVQLETAAAGVAQDGDTGASKVIVEGVGDPAAIRDRIVERLREVRDSGLGDEEGGEGEGRRGQEGEAVASPPGTAPDGGWHESHLAVLREIRSEVRRLRGPVVAGELPERLAVSFAVHRGAATGSGEGPEGDEVLAVLRPPDDEDLPDQWGLPAAGLAEGEGWEDGLRRAGREKLGVELEPERVLAEGSQERAGGDGADYRLVMRVYRARIVDGEPDPGAHRGRGTRYVGHRWVDPAVLRTAAERGSLCTRLYLEARGESVEGGGGSVEVRGESVEARGGNRPPAT